MISEVQKQKGFTLVELAIVLTIVGLLIGGILKGQQLMQNSRVTATVAQVNSFEAATTSFRDAYGELPGDLFNSQTRISGCNSACNLAGGETGNGKVGIIDWDFKTFQSSPPTAGAFANLVSGETVLFWYHLQQAGLISAVTDEGITDDATATFDGTLPSAKIGGGFWVGNSSGIRAALLNDTDMGMPAGSSYTLLGTVLVMVSKPNPLVSFGATYTPKFTGLQPLTPAIAANIDRKIDDGMPASGQVQAYGVETSCHDAAGYKEGVSAKDCGLIMLIQR